MVHCKGKCEKCPARKPKERKRPPEIVWVAVRARMRPRKERGLDVWEQEANVDIIGVRRSQESAEKLALCSSSATAVDPWRVTHHSARLKIWKNSVKQVWIERHVARD